MEASFILKIILTGGGTAGHVTPNFALINDLKKNNFEIEYIGSKNGMEKKLVLEKGLVYHGISCGKLRRYLSLKNLSDIFRVFKGIFEADKIIKNINPNIIFSKGGFVSVPVVIAGWKNKIPVVIHESDITVGLANKICLKFANVMCTSFEIKNLKKTVWTGTPIRKEILSGNKERARKKLNFDKRRVLLVIGGSLGSKKINDFIRTNLNMLNDFQVIHICGKNNCDKNIDTKNYRQFEYVNDDLGDFFALADIIISRSGSNSIFEFLALKKLNLLIPLSNKSSRGDQILNANFFYKHGFSELILEENLNSESFFCAINKLIDRQNFYINNMLRADFADGTKKIMEQIKKYALK